jgi:hypothetical protein
MKTCEDFEDEGQWDTSLCCAWCHGLYLADEQEHELERISIPDGGDLEICKPLYEQLVLGVRHFRPEEEFA